MKNKKHNTHTKKYSGISFNNSLDEVIKELIEHDRKRKEFEQNKRKMKKIQDNIEDILK